MADDLNRGMDEDRENVWADGRDEMDDDFLEETAEETAPLDRSDFDKSTPVDRDHRGESWVSNGIGYGILALILSIISFFFLPVVMGAAGIIIGFIARSRGAGAWGGWAIGVGIAGIALNLFFSPFS